MINSIIEQILAPENFSYWIIYLSCTYILDTIIVALSLEYANNLNNRWITLHKKYGLNKASFIKALVLLVFLAVFYSKFGSASLGFGKAVTLSIFYIFAVLFNGLQLIFSFCSYDSKSFQNF